MQSSHETQFQIRSFCRLFDSARGLCDSQVGTEPYLRKCYTAECLDLPPHGRMAAHNMVIYGNGNYFVDHIPMLRQPHDFQIIAAVDLLDGNGKPIHPDLSKGAFVLTPTSFPLNDYLSCKIKTMTGAILAGSEGGPPVPGLKKVQVIVKVFQIHPSPSG